MTLLQGAAICVVAWFLWRLRYLVVPSSLDNIPGPASPSLLKGNFGQLFHPHSWAFQRELGEDYESVVKIHGMFGQKHLFVFDPMALHSVIVRDQHIYEESVSVLRNNYLIFGPSLLSTLGDLHRKQRKMLNPVFSITHMRHVLPIFRGVVHKLCTAIEAQVGDETVEVDMLNWMGRVALELIGQAGLGYSFDPLTVQDTSNDYGDAMKMLLPTFYKLPVARRVIPLFSTLGPAWLRRRILEYIPNKNVQKLKNIVDTMEAQAKEIFHAKKKALEGGDEAMRNHIGEGKDIMSILLRANMAAAEGDRLSDEEIIGQMSSITFAATDTTSSALAHILYLLAEDTDIQEKLRAEVTAASDGDALSYDELVNLPYLDAVCREMLRLYPPVIFVPRTARKDMILPVSSPIRGIDGNLMQEIHVPEGTGIIVSILASNRNKAIWGDDALEYKPERWLHPLPEKVKDAHIPGVYSNLMTFIGGNRSCIGFKFSQLEMKVVLAVLVRNFRFALSDKDITWNLAGVKYPTIGEQQTKPQLPLMVTRINTRPLQN